MKQERVEIDPFSNIVYNHLAKKIEAIVSCGHKGYEQSVGEIVNWLLYPQHANGRFIKEICQRAREKKYHGDPDKPEEYENNRKIG